jgi:hypothetical protein
MDPLKGLLNELGLCFLVPGANDIVWGQLNLESEGTA